MGGLFIFLSLLLLSTAALSTATPCRRFTDNFDTDNVGTLLPQGDPVGIQNGLNYTNLVIGNKPNSKPFPPSTPNVAGIGLSGILQDLGSLTLFPYGSIAGTPATPYFDLDGLYFGCVMNFITSTSPSATCQLGITGFNRAGQQVSSDTLSFLSSSTNMVYKKFEGFKEMRNVTFGVVSALLLPSTVLLLDDVTHCNYAK